MKYHPDLYDEPFFCPACGWEGTGHEADDMDGYDGCIDMDVSHMVCPRCASDVERAE